MEPVSSAHSVAACTDAIQLSGKSCGSYRKTVITPLCTPMMSCSMVDIHLPLFKMKDRD